LGGNAGVQPATVWQPAITEGECRASATLYRSTDGETADTANHLLPWHLAIHPLALVPNSIKVVAFKDTVQSIVKQTEEGMSQ
jgi:hypothetical protein